ncbi:Dps family protein [Arthrobacter rhombi]|uniref:Dps family protein n=1 Tax=Arthrobacter rhombi TaxID=71253 RepID=UPI003FD4A018
MAVGTPTPAGDAGTKLENTEHGFVASPTLHSSLQHVLVDLVNLHLVGKQAHWNIVGANFRDLHLNLDELVAVAREGADTIAERMRALHATPDARVATVANASSLPQFDAGEISTTNAIRLMVSSIEATVGTMRHYHDGIDDADPTSADLLHEYIAKLEQQAWFIGAEIRDPSPRK